MELASILVPDDRQVAGIEHEFIVWAGPERLDFRERIHTLGLGKANLDPGDPFSYRLASGYALTCDQAEAEVACPPVAIEPAFGARIGRQSSEASRLLVSSLPAGWRTEGISTHISISMADDVNDAAARSFAETFATAMMLMLDGQRGMGLLVRPRPGRLEIGGWFLSGEALSAAVTFAVAAARNCSDPAAAHPSRVDWPVVPAIARYGWFVDRVAHEADLCRDGRAAELALISGQRITAGQHLADCWDIARRSIAAEASAEELSLVDRIVSGDLPLPSEGSLEPADARPKPSVRDVFADVWQPRRRTGWEIAPVMITWPTVIFAAADFRRRRLAFAAVPRGYLASFIASLDAGELDELISRYLSRRWRRNRRLTSPNQATTPQLWDELGPRVRLLPAEPFAA